MNPTDVGCGRQAETHPVRRAVLRATTLAVLGPLALLPARTHAAEAGATEILIGQSAQLSGPLAPLTRELIQGASWYFDEVNGKGGVHGRKVRVITLDDGYVAARTAENVKRLIDDDKVLALFNLAGTPTTLAALPILEERKVPLVAPFTGSGALRKKLNPQVFNVRAGYDDELEQIVRHLSTLGVTQVAVAYLNNTFGKDALATAERAAAAHRASLVASAALEVDGKGLDASVRSIAQAKPAAVIVATAGKITSDFIAAYQQLRPGAQFYALSVVSSRQLLQELGERSRGVVIAQVMPHPFGGTNAAARELAILARSNGIEELTYNHMEGFLSAKVLVEGLRRAGKMPTPATLARALEGMHEVDLGDYVVRFSDRNHNASSYVELSVVGRTGRLLK